MKQEEMEIIQWAGYKIKETITDMFSEIKEHIASMEK